MDKETLSNYGWIVICVLVLAVMIALATPFGTFVADAVKSTTQGLFDVNQNALNSTGLINIDGQEFESCPHDYETVTTGDCATGRTSTHTCKLCGKTSTETFPTGHAWDNTGLKCTECGVTVVEYAFKASDYDAKMGTTTRTDAVVVIPETFEYNGKTYKVTSIGQSGFANCDNLTEIIIPSSVTIINDEAFYNCDGLTSIIIPNCITEIGDEVFYYCRNLTKVVIPNSVTKMGDVVFGYCTSLKSVGPTGSNASVEIPYSITHIGDHTFNECSNIESAVIPYTIKTTGRNVFNWCSKLLTVTFEENSQLEVMGYQMFWYSSRLSTINFGGTIDQWNALSFGDAWKSGTKLTQVHCSDGDVTL